MISIAVCTYNGEKYIKEQLQSIINQTRQPDEIIICDDCSKDKTVDIVQNILREWNGQYKIIINKINLGFKKNFEKAIGLCQGDIIFLSDQDDVWDLNKIALMASVFSTDPDTILVFHDAVLVDEKLNLLKKSFWKILLFDPQKFLRGDYGRLLEGNVIQGSACAFRKELFIKAFPFPQIAIHDEWLSMVASSAGNIVPINKPLMMYRQGNNIIGGLQDSVATRIKQWIFNGSKLGKYIDEIVRRKLIIEIYLKRYSDAPCTEQWNDYYKFLTYRINCIYYKNEILLKKVNLYRKYHITLLRTVKALTKDLLCMIFLDSDRIKNHE